READGDRGVVVASAAGATVAGDGTGRRRCVGQGVVDGDCRGGGGRGLRGGVVGRRRGRGRARAGSGASRRGGCAAVGGVDDLGDTRTARVVQGREADGDRGVVGAARAGRAVAGDGTGRRRCVSHRVAHGDCRRRRIRGLPGGVVGAGKDRVRP